MQTKKKIAAVASGGGHWIELVRLRPLLDKHDVEYFSTNKGFAATVEGKPFHLVPEVSRWNKGRVIPVMWQMARILRRIRPSVVISTGAAPGLLGLLVGKMLGARTIWIESVCHAEKISLSGRMALRFCDRVYTQWPHLAGGKVIYQGTVL
ncbi:oligosaccharide biosynthesis protein Alg14 [Flaviaesturariibacter amylovorans]|uniref:Oligosaccharide biosynthesis protein Alg14 n=1 Tax=Flaviaesturariibacter amylovorans TaxID=1084520 RepID=A0ABP8GRS2_9BACT